MVLAGQGGSGGSRDRGGCVELKGELRRWPPVLCSGALGNQSQWRRTSATMVVSQAYQNRIWNKYGELISYVLDCKQVLCVR